MIYKQWTYNLKVISGVNIVVSVNCKVGWIRTICNIFIEMVHKSTSKQLHRKYTNISKILENSGKCGIILLFHAYTLYRLVFRTFSCMGIREFIAPNVTVDNFVPVKLKATIHKVKCVLHYFLYCHTTFI